MGKLIQCSHDIDTHVLGETLGDNVNLQFVYTAQLTTENYNDINGTNDLADALQEHGEIEFPVFRCPYCEELGQGMKGYLLLTNGDRIVKLNQRDQGWSKEGTRYIASEEKARNSEAYATADVRREKLTIY